MQNEELMRMLNIIMAELEKTTNPDLIEYRDRLKEIMKDGMREEEKEEGKVETPSGGRIIEAACDMQAVSK